MIKYVKGDATYPEGEGLKFIVHICNDIGAWGAGFVKAISKRWPEPESEFKKWARQGSNGHYRLGATQYVMVQPDIYVVNMIAQNGIKHTFNVRPLDYGALVCCLENVAISATINNGSVHMPRIGCGLGGGSWNIVEAIINDTMSDLSVTVYDLE